MIVLVPLSRFRITYEVAAGRPFSQLERMILRAIKEGVSELAELRETFQVHPRLLIEGLVTLTHAGWLSIGGLGHEGFVLTSGGDEAATSDQPPSTTEVLSRQATVVMERLTGALISNNELRFASRRELREVWDRAVRLAPAVTGNRLDEGQVQHLLPRKQGEWVRWIGPIDMLTKDANWLPVSVDIQPENVVGLPDAWIPRLQETIMMKARCVVGTKSLDETGQTLSWPLYGQDRPRVRADEEGPERLRLPSPARPCVVSKDDFCFTAAEHESLMAAALNEAKSSLFVASPCPSIEKLEILRKCIEAALERGVNVDLLLGKAEEGAQNWRSLTDWSSKVAYDAKREGKGGLRFNREPSGFHGNLLLWDGSAGFSAFVGSYNWLSPGAKRQESTIPRDVTVRILEPAIVAALARCAAGFWSAVETEVLSSTADRWRGIAADLDMVATRGITYGTNAKVCLILDGEHDTLLRDWKSRTQSRLFVASHQLGSLKEILSVDPNNEGPGSFDFNIMYGETDEDDTWLAGVSNLFREKKGSLRCVEDFHGEVLISDRFACVTSYNVLAADSLDGTNTAREIGVVIEGQQLIDWLWKQLNAQ